MKPKRHILLTIVLSQFLCTSLWFAGNSILPELKDSFGLGEGALGYLTSSVQFGFISGTLVFALLSIADRYSPSKVFFVCALLGGSFNLGIIWEGNSYISILIFRFLTGFFLAGIYPVGMKIASDYFEKGLGKSLGFLVGALVIGTAFPHLLKDLKGALPWEFVLIATSILATSGGVLMVVCVQDGPFRKSGQVMSFSAIPQIFRDPSFRSAAFGYFGHMWELYAFWAFVPVMLSIYEIQHALNLNIPLLSFSIIGIGGVACVLAGYLAEKYGVKTTASVLLLLSGLCCMIAPVIFIVNSLGVFVTFLLFWGMVVIADSPLFSTMVAQRAPLDWKGTALTIVNSLGFAITIISIQLINFLSRLTDSPIVLTVLVVGPVVGLIALKNSK